MATDGPVNKAADENRSEEPTEESFKMLESEEGQLNAVFAYFGSAAQHAQLFEEALANLLLAFNKILSESVSIRDLESLEETLRRQTMGTLLGRLKKVITIDDQSVLERFNRALERRNFLMHHFFLKRHRSFGSVEGRFALLAELVSIERILDDCRILANAMRIAMCRQLGVPDEWAPEQESNAGR